MTRPAVVDLGVEEAYRLLESLHRFDLPPLEAIEYEDWGRDWLLSRFLEFSAEELEALGLEWDRPGRLNRLEASPGGA